MNHRWLIGIIGIGIVVLLTGGLLIGKKKNNSITATPTIQPTTSPSIIPPSPTPIPTTPPSSKPTIVLPIDQFNTRITKKSFGTYVTPAHSTVSPERFTGYHTGVDIEYGDVTADISVRAIAEGEVVVSQTASGYGGVMVIRHNLQGQSTTALYGHFRPSSMKKVGTKVAANDQIGVLGTAYSSETDNERRHLHFSLRKDASTTIRGYVQSQSELSDWQDPQAFFRNLSIH